MYKLLGLVSLALLVLLGACKAETPPEKQARICRQTPVPNKLQTTISSDGQMIAVLSYVDNCGRKRLRYKSVDPQGAWNELPIAPGVNSIRFGLTGHELMVTRFVREGAGTWLGDEVNKVDSWSELYKVDLDHPSYSPLVLYEGFGLTHPIEVEPGTIIIQNCVTTPNGQCHGILGWQWDLINNGKLIHRWPYGGQYGNKGNMNFGWPNVVADQGVFWFKPRGYSRQKEAGSDFWSLAFPGKIAPQYLESLSKDTEGLACDYKSNRCIRDFGLQSDRKNIPQGYDREVIWKKQHCSLNNLQGDSYEKSLTPDGSAAVMSLDDDQSKFMKIIFIKFSPSECQPVSVQKFSLEE